MQLPASLRMLARREMLGAAVDDRRLRLVGSLFLSYWRGTILRRSVECLSLFSLSSAGHPFADHGFRELSAGLHPTTRR